LLLTILVAAPAIAQQSLEALVDREITQLVSTYKTLHAAPELSHYEEKTSAFFAAPAAIVRLHGHRTRRQVRSAAVLRLRRGRCLEKRSWSDPADAHRPGCAPGGREKRRPLRQQSQDKNESGQEVSVMHACGHDIHITSMLGTAKLLAALKDQWKGTLVIIGQPAEETVDGAKAMLADGLYTRFPKPDFTIGLHDSADVEAGKITYTPGYAMASSTSVDVIIRGLGGHGSKPEATKDPIVVASQTIMALQTIISRENSPLDPAVVTIGSIHGGTKRNIIPDEVVLQLTIRTYKEEVRQRIIASIERIARGVAAAAGIPEERAPIVKVIESENAPSLYNDPQLTERIAVALGKAIGADNVIKAPPLMASEDFGHFSLDHQIPVLLFLAGRNRTCES
jgi:hippurate hydrolase